MKKRYIVYIVVVAIVILSFLVAARVLSPEDGWICEKGEWVKHGNPSSPAPISGCGSDPIGMKPKGDTDFQQRYEAQEKIKVTSLKPHDVISSPVEIEGEARGIWYFEGSFPIIIKSEEGDFLGQGIAYAQGEWMTEDFVPFHSVATFDPKGNNSGYVVFKKDNPSDLEEYDESIEIPIKFSLQEQVKVKVFFGKLGTNSSEDNCDKVYPIERNISKTKAVGKASLEQLLMGLNEDEKDEYFTSINSGVRINSLAIENGVARVDFDGKIEEGVGGSCRTSSIRAQITETLKQFPAVKSVIISVEGRIDDALQP